MSRDPFRHKAAAAWRTLGWQITSAELSTLWHRQNGQCGISGQPMDLPESTLDHIVPVSRGGSNELTNLRWASKYANRAKGNLLDVEFVALCRQIVLFLGGRS